MRSPRPWVAGMLLGALLLLGGCSASGPGGPRSEHGTMPWGKPPAWEGRGRLGGALDGR